VIQLPVLTAVALHDYRPLAMALPLLRHNPLAFYFRFSSQTYSPTSLKYDVKSKSSDGIRGYWHIIRYAELSMR
jgi:hypothetical protein